MLKKRSFIVAIFCAMGILASAHEFWIESDRFYFKVGEDASIRFKVGDDFVGEAWKARKERVVRLDHHRDGMINDLKDVLADEITDPFPLQLTREGSHLVALESSPAFIKLDGVKFTEYLQEDGLDEILYQRKKDQTTGDSASEFYSRHAKLILQAGSKTDDTFKKVCNMPIEIIPVRNPALLKKGDPIAFKILFEGKPLFGAKVKVWNRHNHRVSVQNIFSQQDGMIETHVSNPGVWMVSVVKMVPSTARGEQYRSYWGTLVFGVR